jgi:putative transposase
VYWIVLHFLQFFFDVMTVSHLSEREKDVQILLLRQQLRIVERKQQHAPRLLRWQKVTLALLAGWLQRQGKVGQARLREVSLVFQPQTLLKWHRKAVRRKWTFRQKGQVGRPRTAAELEALVVRVARENPDWGYSRLEDELAKLGFDIGETTIRDILKRDELPPAPERSRMGSSWRAFLQHYQDQMLACDFLTVETLGLQTLYILFFIHLSTRRVFVAGCTAHPDSTWVTQ